MNTRQIAAAALNTLILIVASVVATGSWLAPLIMYGIVAIGAAILLAGYVGVAAAKVGNDLEAIQAMVKTSNEGTKGFILRIVGLTLMSALLYLLAPAEMAVQLLLVYLITMVTSRTIRWLITGKAAYASDDEEECQPSDRVRRYQDMKARRDLARARILQAERTNDWSAVSDADRELAGERP